MSLAQRISIRNIVDGFRDPVVVSLGATQTIGYGTLFYAYGVLAPAIATEFGVGLDWFFGLFSIGLLIGGFAAPLVGRQIDQRGGRIIMTIGSFWAALSLGFLAIAGNIWFFAIGVVLMEIAACAVLYEAAFGSLTQIYRHDARRKITAITLIAGFASTIFWPLTQGMLTGLGWRWTFAIFALLHLLLLLPLHWRILAGALPLGKTASAPTSARPEPLILLGEERRRALILYTIAICASGIIYSSFPVHLLRIIENEGFSAEAAALLAMVMGPAQVLARIVEILGGHRFDALMTGRVALGALIACILVLVLTDGSATSAVLFAVLYGVSQGLITIARGTVPLQLFGVEGYATLVGRVTGLRFLVNAAGPFAFASAATHMGVDSAVALNGFAAALALAAFLALRRPDIRTATAV